MTPAPGADDGATLERVLAGTTALIAAVPPGSGQRPTPCPKYDVDALVEHLVSWLRTFEAAFAAGTHRPPAGPAPGADPAADFAATATSVLAHWRNGGPQATVTLAGPPTPGPMIYQMMVGEYLVHGWDLAVATGQPVPYTAEDADRAYAALHGMLKPEYRGEAFGAAVPAPADATPLDKLVAFSGRDPQWTAPAT